MSQLETLAQGNMSLKYIKKKKKSNHKCPNKPTFIRSLDQLSTKKIAWQENGKRRIQLNIPKIVCHGQLNWLHQKPFAKLSNIHERKIRESLEINNLETKAEYNKSIKVLNRNRGNIVLTNSWKPLFRKINMRRHANAMK